MRRTDVDSNIEKLTLCTYTYVCGYKCNRITNFVVETNLPKALKSWRVLRPTVLLSRLPRTRFQTARGRLRDTHAHHKGSRRDCAVLCAGNERERIFADIGEEEGNRDHGVRREEAAAPPQKDPSRRKSRHEDGRGRATAEGMINTRALFSDFLPRDPRAQIACK